MDNTSDSTSPQSPPDNGLRTFLILWLAQTVSLMGSQLTAFGLGVQVYQDTGSTTLHALIAVANMAPRTFFVLLLGGLADRWDLRKLVLASQAGSGLCTLLLAVLAGTGRLGVGPVIALVALSAVAGSVQPPALTKLTTLLVPARQLGRANGLNQLSFALAYILSPLLAGLLLTGIGLRGILIIDLASFAFAVGVLALLRIKTSRAPPAQASATPAARAPVWQGAREGWRYVAQRPGLLGLVIIFAVMNYNLGTLRGLITPLVLSFSDVRTLGTILFTGGIGMLAGSVGMMVWGGPRRRIHGVLGFLTLQGGSLLLCALTPSPVLVAASAFGVMLSIPLIQSCGQTLMQQKVATDIQGRVHAASSALAGGGVMLAYLLAGPLSDHLFEPLMSPTGALAGSAGRLLGTGPGRGIALLFALLGLQTLMLTLVGVLRPSIFLMEEQLPDLGTERARSGSAQPAPSP